jgi:hypothetical protein
MASLARGIARVRKATQSFRWHAEEGCNVVEAEVALTPP